MRPTIVLVPGDVAESSRRPSQADPMALDPLSPIAISPIEDINSTTNPVALDPLSPIPAGSPCAHSQGLGEVGELLEHLDSWPYLLVDRRTDRVILRLRDLVIGTVNLVMPAVSVHVPPDAVGPMLERDPLRRPTTDGVSVHVTDSESRAAAEALVRWRVDLEVFGPQLHAASP